MVNFFIDLAYIQRRIGVSSGNFGLLAHLDMTEAERSKWHPYSSTLLISWVGEVRLLYLIQILMIVWLFHHRNLTRQWTDNRPGKTSPTPDYWCLFPYALAHPHAHCFSRPICFSDSS